MSDEITTVKYLINQLVDVRVACQFWIDKDHKSQERIKELEEQLAHSYDSGLEAVHPEDTSEHYLPEPTPEERKAYNKDRIQEFIKEHLQEDPRDYPEEQYE